MRGRKRHLKKWKKRMSPMWGTMSFVQKASLLAAKPIYRSLATEMMTGSHFGLLLLDDVEDA